ncbi:MULTISPECIES: hypothetical protein [Nocardia]|uniref:hypothetical protein n=1 Tax=Nocardia TaxID=1817 RepID=UPI0013587C53|nr:MULTISPECIES: hypothetical protein [Nocardia]MBF6203959.1 hypothetical protein [Streptomyces gardneri]
MSPKKQPTAAKRARAAAREGDKYTTALRGGTAAGTRTEPEPVDPELIVAGRARLHRDHPGVRTAR